MKNLLCLICVINLVSGTPKPDMVWKVNGRIFNPVTTDRYSLTEDNLSLELTIDKCTLRESGCYTLEISNKYGFDTCSATVQVIGKVLFFNILSHF